MVGSIGSFNPSTYLSQLQNNQPLTAVADTAPVSSDTQTATPASPTSPATPVIPSTSSASLNNLIGLSPNVLSLLQGVSDSTSSGSITSALVGSASTSSNPLAGLFSALLSEKTSTQPTQAAVEATQASHAQKSQSTSQVQSLINSYNTRINSNNTTLLKDAQNVINQGNNLVA